MITTILLQIVLLLILVFASILFHELGHYAACKNQGIYARFGFDMKGFYVAHTSVDDKKRKQIIGWAVGSSFIPAFIVLPFSVEHSLATILIMLMGQLREIEVLRRLSI